MQGLAGVIERVRELVSAIRPDSFQEDAFVEVKGDIERAQESARLTRTYYVEPMGGAVLTNSIAGRDAIQYEGRFQIVVLYDPRTEIDDVTGAMLEDAERIVHAVMFSDGYPSGTHEVLPVGPAQFEAGEGNMVRARHEFRAIFTRTF